MSKFSRGPWHAAIRTTRAGERRIEVRNTSRDPVAIVFTNEHDARLMAASLRLLGMLVEIVAILTALEGSLDTHASRVLKSVRALIAEVSA